MNNIINIPKLITFKEAADCLTVSLRQIERWVEDGLLPVVVFGYRCKRIDCADLQKFINNRKNIEEIMDSVQRLTHYN